MKSNQEGESKCMEESSLIKDLKTKNLFLLCSSAFVRDSIKQERLLNFLIIFYSINITLEMEFSLILMGQPTFLKCAF